jgi:hypothetical protein
MAITQFQNGEFLFDNGAILTVTSNAAYTDRQFDGSRHFKETGEKYTAEYVIYADDEGGVPWEIFYQFPAVKGSVPPIQSMPFEDVSHITIARPRE